MKPRCSILVALVFTLGTSAPAHAELTIRPPLDAIVTEPVVEGFEFTVSVPADFTLDSVTLVMDDTSNAPGDAPPASCDFPPVKLGGELPHPEAEAPRDTEVVLYGAGRISEAIVPTEAPGPDSTTEFRFQFALPLWQPGANRFDVLAKASNATGSRLDAMASTTISYDLPEPNLGIGSDGPGGRLGTSFELPGIPLWAEECPFVFCKDADQDGLLDLWENVAVEVLRPELRFASGEDKLDHPEHHVRTLVRVNPVVTTGGRFWGNERATSALAFGNVDDDEAQELAIGRNAGGNERWMILDDDGAGSGYSVLTVGGSREWGRERGTTALAFGDVDGDGRDELAIGRNAGANERWQIVDDALAGFAVLTEGDSHFWGEERGTTALAFGDVDGDGRDELAIGRSAGGNERWKIVNDRWEGFALMTEGDSRSWRSDWAVTALAFGDVDGDGRDELAIGRSASPEGQFRWQIVDDAGAGFAPMTEGDSRSWRGDWAVTALAFGDVDGDGRDELAVGRSATPEGQYRWQIVDDADAGYAVLTEGGSRLWGNERATTALAFGDMDEDGRDELAIGRNAGGKERWQIVDDASAGFAVLTEGESRSWREDWANTALAFGDADGDLKAELAIGRSATPESNFRWRVVDDPKETFRSLGRRMLLFRHVIAFSRDYGFHNIDEHNGDSERVATLWDVVGNRIALDSMQGEGHLRLHDLVRFVASLVQSGFLYAVIPIPGSGLVALLAGVSLEPDIPAGGRGNWTVKPESVRFTGQGVIKILVEENKHGLWANAALCDHISEYDCDDDELGERPAAANVGEPSTETWEGDGRAHLGRSFLDWFALVTAEGPHQDLLRQDPPRDSLDSIFEGDAVWSCTFGNKFCGGGGPGDDGCTTHISAPMHFPMLDEGRGPELFAFQGRYPRVRDAAPDLVTAGAIDPEQDADGDGLRNAEEIALGTNPFDPDSDADGWTDGQEVHETGTDPLDPDTDADGVREREEVEVYGTDPLESDSDGDGVSDGRELELGTDPTLPDSDGDGVPDGRDPQTLESAIRQVPDDLFVSEQLADVMLARVEAIARRIDRGDIAGALRELGVLREKVDGCGSAPEGGDWILDCATQLEIRRLIDLVVEGLGV